MRMIFLPLVLVLAGCGGRDAAPPPTDQAPASASPPPAAGANEPLTGPRTFVIVPDQSQASYVASEEFFAGALKKLGINAGKRRAVGSTQAIEGKFEFDPEHPTSGLLGSTFSVRMDTFTTDQSMRDAYIREEGPNFYVYPLATFKTTAVDGGPSAYRSGDELNVRLTGDLTIRLITKATTFDVKARQAGDTLTGTATTRILMSSFGIEPLDFYNTLTVADEVGLEVRFTARAQPR